MGTVKTLLTLEQFEQRPDYAGRQELVGGELIEMPPADLEHNRISHRIYKGLDIAIESAHRVGEAAELGVAYHEMGYLLDASWLQPDVSVTHAGQKEGKYFLGAPAIAIEVISSADILKRTGAKVALYFEFGALEVWHFFPRTKNVTIRASGGIRNLTTGDFLTTPLLPRLELSVAEIFAV